METLKNKISVIVLLMTICLGNSIYGLAANKSWNGQWTGKNETGDILIELNLNVDEQVSLNPYNEQSLCNGFITVYSMVSGEKKSILGTYELQLDARFGTMMKFQFSGGRTSFDNAEGKCDLSMKEGILTFKVTEKTGDKVLFDQVEYKKNVDLVVPTKQQSIFSHWKEILFFLAYIAMIAHMVYLHIKGARYKKPILVEDMVIQRTAQGKTQQMSGEEYDQCANLLENAFVVWSVDGYADDGSELRKPKKMKQIKASVLLIDQAIALLPTEQDLVDRINELADVINSNEKRYFDGSKALVWLGAIVGILLGFLAGPGVAIATLVSTGAYVLASRTPAFLVEKRAEKGRGNVHNGMIAGVFAMIAGARTIRTITTYSDGHKEYDDDHSQHWIAWIFGLLLLVFIASLMAIWAIINYLRNYVLYF